MGRLRLGVVLLPPPAVSSALEALRLALGDPGRERIQAHLTLASPVNVDESSLGAVLDLLRRAARETSPFEVQLGPPRSFLPASEVIYAPVLQGVEEVSELRQRLNVSPIARQSAWPYVPHVTLCERASQEQADAAVKCLAHFSAWAAFSSVVLMRKDQGMPWRPMADFAFSGRPQRVGTGGFEVEFSLSSSVDPEIAAWRNSRCGAEEDRWAQQSFVVARHLGEIAGLAHWLRPPGRFELAELIVDPALRGRGIGSLLLARVEQEARSAGFARIEAVPRLDSAAQGFLSRWGWRPSYPLPGWFGTTEGIRMEKVPGELL